MGAALPEGLHHKIRFVVHFGPEKNDVLILFSATITDVFLMQENPFRDRILKVFSSNGSGDLSFEDFLDLLSIFSERAPRELKLHYAFQIYGKFVEKHYGRHL